MALLLLLCESVIAYPRLGDRVAFDPAGMSVAATTFRKCSSAGFVALRFSRHSANKYLRVDLNTGFSSVCQSKEKRFSVVSMVIIISTLLLCEFCVRSFHGHQGDVTINNGLWHYSQFSIVSKSNFRIYQQTVTQRKANKSSRRTNLQVIMLASTQLCSTEGFLLLEACAGGFTALLMLILEPFRTSSSIMAFPYNCEGLSKDVSMAGSCWLVGGAAAGSI